MILLLSTALAAPSLNVDLLGGPTWQTPTFGLTRSSDPPGISAFDVAPERPGWDDFALQVDVGGPIARSPIEALLALGWSLDNPRYAFPATSFTPTANNVKGQLGLLLATGDGPRPAFYASLYTGLSLQVVRALPFYDTGVVPGSVTTLGLGGIGRIGPVRVRAEARAEILPWQVSSYARAQLLGPEALWFVYRPGYSAVSLLIGLGYERRRAG